METAAEQQALEQKAAREARKGQEKQFQQFSSKILQMMKENQVGTTKMLHTALSQEAKIYKIREESERDCSIRNDALQLLALRQKENQQLLLEKNLLSVENFHLKIIAQNTSTTQASIASAIDTPLCRNQTGVTNITSSSNKKMV